MILAHEILPYPKPLPQKKAHTGINLKANYHTGVPNYPLALVTWHFKGQAAGQSVTALCDPPPALTHWHYWIFSMGDRLNGSMTGNSTPSTSYSPLQHRSPWLTNWVTDRLTGWLTDWLDHLSFPLSSCYTLTPLDWLKDWQAVTLSFISCYQLLPSILIDWLTQNFSLQRTWTKWRQ